MISASHDRAPAARRPLLRPAEVAELLGLIATAKDPERIVREMCRRGTLRALRVGKWTMVDPASVDAFLDGRR